jgi:hypothetical protein
MRPAAGDALSRDEDEVENPFRHNLGRARGGLDLMEKRPEPEADFTYRTKRFLGLAGLTYRWQFM